MSNLEYIVTYESQRERRLSLQQELHRAESISIKDALPEGFNVDENDSLGLNQVGNHRTNEEYISDHLLLPNIVVGADISNQCMHDQSK